MTITQPQHDLDTNYLTETAAEIGRIDNLIAELTEERQRLTDTLDLAYQRGILNPGTNPPGRHTVTIREGARRLDTRKIEFAYPAELHPGLYTPKLDTKSVRAAFAANTLRDFETQGAPSISVKPADA